ncbi:MAG: hypothetical protein Q4F70_00850 [Clostridia bacterium]|nr:hypothetical protein [Clostridia bacterium]
MKKIIALVLALAMVLSLATTSAFACKTSSAEVAQKSTSLIQKLIGINPLGSIFSDDDASEATIAVPSFSDILANVKKGLEGTGLVYGRDYKVTVEDDSTFGYRIHIIQPTTGTDLFDNYLVYKDGAWTYEKAWALPTMPNLSLEGLAAAKDNIYKALWDSGIYVDLDQDIQVTRDSEDGFKVLIIDPLTGRTIYDKQFIITDSKTINWKNEFEPISEDSILAAHFPTTEEAQEEIIPAEDEQESEIPAEITVIDDATPQGAAVIEDTTPLADAPAEEIANTGDAAFSAMAAVTVLAGAAFVATKKHN